MNAQPAPDAAAEKEQLRSALDDLASTKRRLERDAQRGRDETRGAVIAELLPVLDNLDRSIAAGQDTSDAALLEGIKMVRAQFEDALSRCGLQRVESVGSRFDPSVHEAVAVVDVDDPALDGAVLDEWERGYRFGDKLLRAPKVRVGRSAAR